MADDFRYQRILSAVVDTPWAILPGKLAAIRSLLELRAAGVTLTDADIRARLGGDPPAPRPVTERGTVAIIPIFGVLSQRLGMMATTSGGTSTETLARDLRAAVENPSIKTIVLPIDSPGGSVPGITELAATIREKRSVKRIIAVIDPVAASAALWLGAQASEVIITPSGEAGSIGVLAAHENLAGALDKAGIEMTLISAGPYKAEGSPFSALTPEAKAAIQRRVDASYGRFLSDVAKGRRVSVDTVRRDYGQGRMLSAEDALAAGLVDRIAPFDTVLAELQGASAATRERPASALTASAISALFAQVLGPPPRPAVDRAWRDRVALDLLRL